MYLRLALVTILLYDEKRFSGFKKGDCYIRRGSQQDRLTRRDLDELLASRSNYYFNGKISVGFNGDLEKK